MQKIILALFLCSFSSGVFSQNKYDFRVEIQYPKDNQDENCENNMLLPEDPVLHEYLRLNKVSIKIQNNSFQLEFIPSSKPRTSFYDFSLTDREIEYLKNRVVNNRESDLNGALEFKTNMNTPLQTIINEVGPINYFLHFDQLRKLNKETNKLDKETKNIFTISYSNKYECWSLRCPMILNPPPFFSLSLFDKIVNRYKKSLDSLINISLISKNNKTSKTSRSNFLSDSFNRSINYLKLNDTILLDEQLTYILRMDTSWISRDINQLAKVINYFSSRSAVSTNTYTDSTTGYSITLNKLTDTIHLKELAEVSQRNKRFFSFFKSIYSQAIVYSDTLNSRNILLVNGNPIRKHDDKFVFFLSSNLYRIVRVTQSLVDSNYSIESRNINLMFNIGVKPFNGNFLSKSVFAVGLGFSTFNKDSSTVLKSIEIAPSMNAGIYFRFSQVLYGGFSFGRDLINRNSRYYTNGLKQRYWYGVSLGLKL